MSTPEPNTPDLSHPMYNTELTMANYTRVVTTLSALSASDSAKVLRRLAPELTKSQHIELGHAHAIKASQMKQAWAHAADQAAMATFGRPFAITDYIISAIGREEFSDQSKAILRQTARDGSQHTHAAMAHYVAAGISQWKARDLLRSHHCINRQECDEDEQSENRERFRG